MGRGWLVGIAVTALGCGRIGFDPGGSLGDAGDANTNPPPMGFGPAATGCGPITPADPVVYVATTGSDTTGNGSITSPYRTIQMTYDRVAPGTMILVQPGIYGSVNFMRMVSPQRITVAAITPYTVRVEDASLPFACNGCTGLVVDGIYVHATGTGGLPVMHINGGQDVVIRNCIVDNAGTSASIRLSGDPVNVSVLRNMLYDGNPPLHAAQITGATIQDNVVVHTRTLNGAILWLEAPLGGVSRIQRNILAGFSGCVDCGMLEMRLDNGTSVASNLLISGSAPSDGAFKLEGPTNAAIQFNTIVGDVPGTAFALTGTQYNSTPVSNLTFTNNVFADPTGTLGDFSDGTPTDITSPVVMSNAYWNGGQALAPGINDAVDPFGDPQAVLGDPQLPSFTPFTAPLWDPVNLQFSDGSKTICDEFYRLALQYGMPAATSPLAGAATGADRPLDLLGFARTSMTIGALEVRN